MAEIRMNREHRLEDPTDVRSRIEGLADKVSARLGGTWDWEGDQAVCEARGAVARVGYDEKEISIVIRLPMMLRPLRGAIESKIEEYYKSHFDCD